MRLSSPAQQCLWNALFYFVRESYYVAHADLDLVIPLPTVCTSMPGSRSYLCMCTHTQAHKPWGRDVPLCTEVSGILLCLSSLTQSLHEPGARFSSSKPQGSGPPASTPNHPIELGYRHMGAGDPNWGPHLMKPVLSSRPKVSIHFR